MSIPFIYMRRLSVMTLLACLSMSIGGIRPAQAQDAAATDAGKNSGGIPGVDATPAASYPEDDPRRNAAAGNQSPTESGSQVATNAAASDQKQQQEAPASNQSQSQKQARAADQGDPGDAELRSRFPLIRNLRVEPDREFPHSFRIRWDVDPQNDTAIYVGRYVRPLATRELILEAENLTSPPLGPRSTSYVDRNIPDGAYYYVVVTTFEMSKRNTVVLQPNVNYTTTASVIFREGRDGPGPQTDQENNNGGESSKGNALEVTNLFAVNSGESVKLSWRPPDRSDVRYNVYRSEQPLDSPAALRSATRLAVVEGRQYIYEDRNPVADRQVFYGVSVTDPATNREEQKLYANRSFVAHTYRKQREEESGNDESKLALPDALTVFLAGKDTVRLLWVNPETNAPRDYRVYRATRPINSVGALGQAAFIGSVRGSSSGYRDEGLRPGTYYYAVLPRDARGREIRSFVEGRTFTGFAVNINEGRAQPEPDRTDDGSNNGDLELSEEQRESLKEPVIEYLQARGGQDAVDLNWSVARSDLGSFQILLFRSDKPMRSLKQIREWGVRAATLPGDQRAYTDAGLDAGRYFYAAVLDFSDHFQESMLAGRNYLAFPIEVGGRDSGDTTANEDDRRLRPDFDDPNFDGSLYELNRVLALTYHKQRYGEAIRRIAPFLNSSQIATNVRAKALLYTGLSLYHTRQYRTSLDYFLQDAVREFYPERADFWYNRSIKRLR